MHVFCTNFCGSFSIGLLPLISVDIHWTLVTNGQLTAVKNINWTNIDMTGTQSCLNLNYNLKIVLSVSHDGFIRELLVMISMTTSC